LKCHHCGGVLAPKDTCSRCSGTRIVYLGEGTERAEEEIAELFPETRSARMDYDTTRRRDAHRKIIDSMESGENQLLLGTQMVAKGHDLPGVLLAGVLSAVVMLGLPDFRSAEKAFQLFSQLAGRAGRGTRPGRVLIQSHDPEHYVFDFVRNHDYEGFARFEMEQRKSVGFPPFSRLVRIVFSGRNLATFEPAMNRMETFLKGLKVSNVRILGPSVCPIERLRGAWRWHALLKSGNIPALRKSVLRMTDFASTLSGLEMDVDVDPVHML
jgi:primosomal protein N' (replication factor Y)